MLRLNGSVITKFSALLLTFCCSINLLGMANDIRPNGICIFDATGEPTGWNDHQTSTKKDFLKAMCNKMPHIFITPDIWQSYIIHRQELMNQLQKYLGIQNPTQELTIKNKNVLHQVGNTEYLLGTSYGLDVLNQLAPQYYTGFGIPELLGFDSNQWNLYDTHTGLYYLQKKDTPPIGIQVQHFSHLDPNNPGIPITYFEHWTESLHSLFDKKEWNRYNQQGQQKTFITLHGHGSQRADNPYQIEGACGMSADRFARLLRLFNDEFHIDMLAIDTCYWTAQRAIELIRSQYNYDFLNYVVISTIEAEQITSSFTLEPIKRFDPRTQEIEFHTAGLIFDKAIERIAQQYNGCINNEIRLILNNIDNKLNSSTEAYPSWVLPGQIQAETLTDIT